MVLGGVRSPIKYVAVLTPGSVNVALFGNRLFAEDQVKTRPLGLTLIQQECGPYTKGEFDAETHTERAPRADEGRFQVIHGRAEERQGCWQTPEAWEEPGKTLSHGLRRTQPCPHLDLGLLASRTWRPYASVVQTT